MVWKVICRTRRPKVTIRYKDPAGPAATRASGAEPPAPPDPPAAGGRPAMPAWHGRRIKIEDLPAVAARWGLVAVRGEWPAGEPCPRLFLVETRP